MLAHLRRHLPDADWRACNPTGARFTSFGLGLTHHISGTLTYDHAKNHPLNVDLDLLHECGNFDIILNHFCAFSSSGQEHFWIQK